MGKLAVRAAIFGLLVVASFLVAVRAARAEPSDTRPSFDEECRRFAEVAAPAGKFRLLAADREGCTIGLLPSEPGEGPRPDQILGMVYLLREDRGTVPRFHSRHFWIQIGDMTFRDSVTPVLVRAARMIADSDGGGGDLPVAITMGGLDELLDAGVLCWLVALALMVIRRRRGLGEVSVEVRLPHLIPVLIQTTIFTYWSLYWPGVRGQAPIILAQIFLAFGADAAFSLARFGSWRLGASPLPIVLSTNLFVWFDGHGAILSILCAFAAKTLLRRPGAAHIFNPSALGLTVVGIASYCFPDFIHVGGLFHTFSLAPNLAEVILILALVPQMRFRVLPVSLAVVVALRLTGNLTVLRPPMILVATLLLTDPATLPKSDLGKILAGLLYGFTMPVTSWLLRHWGLSDDFAKVIPVPLVNVLAPELDVLATRISSSVARAWSARRARPDARTPSPVVSGIASRLQALASRPVPNYALIAVWLLVSVPPLVEEKAWSFESALHWTWGTPLIERDADDVPRCERNPTFCRPFQFASEIQLWRARLATPRPPSPPSAPASAVDDR